MQPDQQFTCMCLPIMLDDLESTLEKAGGEVLLRDMRSYGAVVTIKKNKTGPVILPMQLL